MDYIKELQALADRLRSMDPGTYFSRVYQYDSNANDEEQRQIIILLQELRLAMESPSLLSAPPQGTVLHTAGAGRELRRTLNHLCLALEKCLFFGAKGSMPDFWWVLGHRGSSAVSGGGGGDGGGGGHSFDPVGTDEQRNDVDDDSGSEETQVRSVAGKRSPEPLATTVCRLTHVHTGHARCRAWVRGLLGMDGASAEGELRRAAASVEQLVARGELALRAKSGDRETHAVHDVATMLPSERETQHHPTADTLAPDDGPNGEGGCSPSSGNKEIVPAAPKSSPLAAAGGPSVTPNNGLDNGHSSSPLPPLISPSLLPLWLRPDPKGVTVLDNVCKSLAEFSGRLEERGLSIRPSLDHSWLDQENLAAATTYAWPKFRRTRLRCYVRGAGLLAANGEYLPIEKEEDEGERKARDGSGTDSNGLSLAGPNGCTICFQARFITVEDETEISAANAAEKVPIPLEASTQRASRVIPYEENGTEMLTTIPYTVETRTTATAPTPAVPVAQVWHLLVPAADSLRGQPVMRSAYFCLGDGPLPPSRGWRSTDMTDAPAPVVGFATQADDAGVLGGGGRQRGREFGEQVAGEEKAAKAMLFPAAERFIGGNNDFGPATVDAAAVLSGTVERDTAKIVAPSNYFGSKSAEHGSQLKIDSAAEAARSRLVRRRKRRRPPERTGGAVHRVELAHMEDCKARSVLVEDGSPAEGRVWSAYGDLLDGGNGSGSWGDKSYRVGDDRHATDEYFGSPTEDGEVLGCEAGDEAVAAFTAERWRLPAPSGELLSRLERARELLLQKSEERASMLALRRRQLQDDVAVAERNFQEVLGESTEATVGRVLAARPDLRDEAVREVALAREAAATAAANGGDSGGGEMTVPSLEELVAEKEVELRRRLDSHVRVEEEARSPPSISSSVRPKEDKESPHATPLEDAGWPWPAEWLSAPSVPPLPLARGVDTTWSAEEDFVDLGLGGVFTGSDGEHADEGMEGGGKTVAPPVPYSIEVAAVEVVDAEGSDAAHVEYVLRVVYHERTRETQSAPATTFAASAVPHWPLRDQNQGDVPADGDREAIELMSLVAAAKCFLQRTRVLSKRLNSLCALHPQLMWELAEGQQRMRSEAEGEVGAGIQEDPPEFPDPFELGTLEESILRVHRDKLTPRFKANSPTRKLSARVGSYLSGLVHFLGALEAAGKTSVRSRILHVLNDALSTCDRAGRKRRRNDFNLGVRIEDIAGGRLGSGGGDEDRLRVQKRSCMGCGRAIAAEFLGIKKDYSPCRFADGLFCRGCCHIEDRRVIPHRVVHHWDFHTHRVCKDSRAFLDATRFLPVYALPKVSPELFAEHQSLRTVRSQRNQLHLLRRAIFCPSGTKCVSGARLLEELLDGRMHLAVNPDLYSMEDLMGVKNGNLLSFLEETNESLAAHVLEGCELCEARAARVCEVCNTGDPIFAFQIGHAASCPICESVLHVKCVQSQAMHHQDVKSPPGSGLTKRWLDQQPEPGGQMFVCPKCKAVTALAEMLAFN